jgi:hypothetical protein
VSDGVVVLLIPVTRFAAGEWPLSHARLAAGALTRVASALGVVESSERIAESNAEES